MTTLCTTPNTLDEATALIASQQSEIQHLKHELAQLKRMIFGQKTEKFVPSVPEEQLTIEGLFDNAGAKVPGFAETKEKISYERRKPGHGRKPIPDDLHREIHLLDVPESDKICSRCDTRKKHIGDDITEELEYKPAVLFVNRYVRPKYACPKNCLGAGITTAELPSRPIDKGIAGPGLISYIITSKYVDHLPLYRLEQMFKRYAIAINRSTMVGWIAQVCVPLQTLHDDMRKTVLKSFVIQADETPLKVMDDTTVDGKCVLGYLWPYVGDGKLAVFEYRDTRNREGPKDFLAGYAGYLQTDGYAGYNAGVEKNKLRHLMCWAHARRKFFDAKDLDPDFTGQVLARIGNLYEIEKRAREHKPDPMTPQQRYELRQAECPAILSDIKQLLENPGKAFVPQNDIAKAIAYTMGHWTELICYLEDGRLDIDNNRCENVIRPVAIGKKNWLFAGSPEGARRMAIIYSLAATCKLNCINFYEYLADILPRIQNYPAAKVADLSPINWSMSKNN